MVAAVLRDGLVAAARDPLLALALYAGNMASAALVAALGLLALGAAAGDGDGGGERPWVAGLLGGDWLNLLVEIVAAGVAGGRVGEAALTAVLLAAIGGLALCLHGLVYALLAGGILERLRDGARARFWLGCRRWFWPFVRLGMLGVAAFAGLGLGGVLALARLDPVLGSSAVLLGAAAWVAVLNGWLELARASMVAGEDQSASGALRRASRLALRPDRLPHVLAAWLALAIVGLALPALQAASTAEPVVGAVVGQAALLGGAWLKVARLATAVALDRRLRPGPKLS